MRNHIMHFFLIIMFTVLINPGFSQDSANQTKDKAAPEFKPEFPKEVLSTTNHSVKIGGNPFSYTATAGNLLLKEEDGRPKANIFFIAYTKSGLTDVSNRPITFSFNGGPGSSSVWLHLGAFGPKRVLAKDDGQPLPPPYQLVDNEYSLLDLTDLVFIDPVTTGYSRAVPGENPSQFHGVTEDVKSVGEFIRLYTTRFNRWSSPKFLAGESYGTTRAAGLAGYLQDQHGMYFNGVILVSSILNFQTARFNQGNDLPFILFLPTYTATAWFHKKLPPDLQSNLEDTLKQVRNFAGNEYAMALMKGDTLSEAEQNQVIQQLSRFTGLSPEYIKQTNLRINISRFVKQLLRGEGLTVGRLDSRFTGYDLDSAGESFENDPSYAAIQGSYTATLNNYVRTELKYQSDLPYEILTDRVRPWNFGDSENEYLNVAETLRKAISQNSYLKVFVANGYYDLATPFYATEYTFHHMGLPPSLSGNISMGYYEAGHMMYIKVLYLAKLKQDLAQFFQSALQK